MRPVTHWGRHLICNIKGAHPGAIRSRSTIEAFSKELVKEINMKPYGEPEVVFFGEGKTAGFTLVQLIHTSNITAHFVDDTNAIYLDVFSCSEFDKKDVERVVRKNFFPREIESYELLR